jgi:hypothetical protein
MAAIAYIEKRFLNSIFTKTGFSPVSIPLEGERQARGKARRNFSISDGLRYQSRSVNFRYHCYVLAVMWKPLSREMPGSEKLRKILLELAVRERGSAYSHEFLKCAWGRSCLSFPVNGKPGRSIARIR